MDPWSDYLALPAAPLVIVVQVLAFAIPDRRVRTLVAATGSIAIFAMLMIVAFVAEPATGADIGGGLLLVELAVSVAVLITLLARDHLRERAREQHDLR